MTSHDELKAGMTVILSPCDFCDGQHVLILAGRCNCAGLGWRLVDRCPHGADCFGAQAAIASGRLYRLQEPPAEANDYDAVAVPTKAKERTR